MNESPAQLFSWSKTTTERFDPLWLRRRFTTMSENYRNIRRNLNPMDTCCKCDRVFKDDQTINLCCVKGKGNVVVCDSCADDIEMPAF